MFKGRKIVIATKHQKEQVIAPLLFNEFGLIGFTPRQLDTDILGTFTGEIERKLSPIEAAKQKCLLAMEQEKCNMAIASEGSFGPHPSLFFVNSDDEILVFMDKRNNIEIIAREVSTKTNFNAQIINNLTELHAFATNALFPSHALIIRAEKASNNEIMKGINNWDELDNAFNYFKQKYGKAYVETDMRACFNPTRMNVIEKATVQLIKKIKSVCPSCQTPGFSVKKIIRGLPCKLCNLPTDTPKIHIYCCNNCHLEKEEKILGKEFEDPMNCSFCNP